MLGVPDVGEVRVVRVQQRGDGELVLRQQRRVLVGVQRRRQRRVDLCQSYPSSIYIDRQIDDRMIYTMKNHQIRCMNAFIHGGWIMDTGYALTWVSLERDGDVLHLGDGLVAVADLEQHQRPPHPRVL